MRKLERAIASVCRKTAKKKLMDGFKRVSVNARCLEEMLGPKKYAVAKAAQEDRIGAVTGLAWTSVGGETLEIEDGVYEGRERSKLPGILEILCRNLRRLQSAMSGELQSNMGLPSDFYKTKDIHIHAPEGAVPKDGPSAGVTMTTALVSALSGIPVRHDVAMTGEISLRGRVMQIGGLKEKAIAAFRAGIHTVVIPYENKPDIAEFDPVIQKGLQFVPVKTIDEVLSVALLRPEAAGGFAGHAVAGERTRAGGADILLRSIL